MLAFARFSARPTERKRVAAERNRETTSSTEAQSRAESRRGPSVQTLD